MQDVGAYPIMLTPQDHVLIAKAMSLGYAASVTREEQEAYQILGRKCLAHVQHCQQKIKQQLADMTSERN